MLLKIYIGTTIRHIGGELFSFWSSYTLLLSLIFSYSKEVGTAINVGRAWEVLVHLKCPENPYLGCGYSFPRHLSKTRDSSVRQTGFQYEKNP